MKRSNRPSGTERSSACDQGYHLDLHATAVPAVLNAHVKLDGLGVLVDSVGKDGPADEGRHSALRRDRSRR